MQEMSAGFEKMRKAGEGYILASTIIRPNAAVKLFLPKQKKIK
jgi:hypothetical protein